jgi:prophage antirepressor-like protein
VRAVLIDGEPYFVRKDVADRLGYADAVNAIQRRCKGVAKRHTLPTVLGVQDVRVLWEPDVLRLIINSKLPAGAAAEHETVRCARR